jgi:hypothetical protein
MWKREKKKKRRGSAYREFIPYNPLPSYTMEKKGFADRQQGMT